MELNKRLGKIDIAQELVHDFSLMKLLFSKFIPLSISYNISSCKYTYKGYSPSFMPIKEGDIIPAYEAEVTNNNELTDLGFSKTSIINFHPLSENGERLKISMGDNNPKIDFVLDRIKRDRS